MDNTCTRCPELCATRTQIVMPEAGSSGLLCVGEAPGEDEDLSGFGFYGRAGKTLDMLLHEHGIERHQYGRANIVRCRPPNNRKPTRMEREACEPLLLEFVRSTRPRVIVAVGGTAAEFFFGKAPLYQLITNPPARPPDPRVAQLLIDAGSVVVPMPHTSPLAWNRNAPDKRKWAEIGRQQIAKAVALLHRAAG